MIGYIYKTTCLPENKIYVGKHESPIWDKYYIGSGAQFSKILKKYGRKNNFKCELLEIAETFEDLYNKEQYWITKLDATNPVIGYNKIRGGFGSLKYIKVIKDNNLLIIERDQLDSYIKLGYNKVNNRITTKIWQQKNKKHLDIWRIKHYNKNKKKINKRRREYLAKNREEINRKQQEYRARTKKARAAYNKRYYQQHKEQLLNYSKKYLKEHKEQANRNTKRFRAKKKLEKLQKNNV